MSIHDGHRARMYEKIAANNFSEHEWLEVLLYPLLPRRDTNPLAHRLLLRFGTAEDMFHASMEELQSVEGVGAAVAAHIKAIGHFLDRKIEKRPSFPQKFDHDDFLPYVKDAYQSIPYEVVDFYLLDGYSNVVACQGFSTEEIHAAKFLPDDLVAFLLSRESSGVVVVHNHPQWIAEPSAKDDELTTNLQMMCSIHHLLLCDHIIYGSDGVYSYYKSGRLREISKQFSMPKIIREKVGTLNLPK